MAQNDYNAFDNSVQPGLFDFRSADEVLADKAKIRTKRTMDLLKTVNPATPADRTASILGGLIGSEISNRYNPPVLSDTERQSTDAISLANQRTQAWRQNNPTASAEDIGLAAQKHMSEELLRQGNYQQGIPMAQMYMQQAQARRMGEQEYSKLSGEVQTQQNTLNYWDMKNRMHNVLIQGETEPREVYVDENGNANYQDDSGKTVQKALGQWHQAPANFRGGKYSPGDDGWTPTQIGKTRDLAAAIPNTVHSYVRLADALEQGYKQDGSINFLGKNGEVNSWVTDSANALSGFARLAGSYLGVGDKMANLADPAQAEAYIKAHPDLAQAMNAQMPESARVNNESRARWLAAAAQLAYSRHQTLEPGAHGMSDQDFKVEMQTIGGQLSDPEAFRKLSLDNFKSQLDNFKFYYEAAPPEIQKRIMAPAAKDTFDKAVAEFDDRYSRKFGTAANPGPGIRRSGNDVVKELLGE
jgi:hypothetical protein